MTKEKLDGELKFRADADMIDAVESFVATQPSDYKKSNMLRQALREFLENHSSQITLREDGPTYGNEGKARAPHPPVAGQTARTAAQFTTRKAPQKIKRV
jgi:uncharacterized protein YciI